MDKNDKNKLLGVVPKSLKDELFKAFNEVLCNFREGRWEPSELNGGKLCEVIYTILQGYVTSSFPAKSTKPNNMLDACKALEQLPSANFPRSVRIQIPRMLIALYEIRNNRGVGHVGGDVDPNHMDAVAVLYMSKWLLAELVRIFHDVDTIKATQEVDAIVERILPIVWKVGDKYRILNTNLSMKDKTLVILFNMMGQVAVSDLVDWLEHSNASVYRSDVLRKLHKDKLIEFNEEQNNAIISPKGTRYVEENVDLSIL
jgi:hypothetical protein